MPTTLTWRTTLDRAFTIAGASPTVAELLAGIKSAIDNDSTYWQTSDYSAGNGTLEIKRKASGSPTGEFATCRLLLFGGSLPNAGALGSSVTASATSLYASGSVDANTTGPSASYTAGAPYSTKYMKAAVVWTTGLTNTTKIMLVESTDALHICIHDTASAGSLLFGYLIDDVQNGVLHWCVAGSRGINSAITSPSSAYGTSVGTIIPSPGAAGACGSYWNSVTGTNRQFWRISSLNDATTASTQLGTSGSSVGLLPTALCEGAAGSTSGAFIGFLKQVRHGPSAQPGQVLRNQASVVQGYNSGGPIGALSWSSLWFDQVY